MPSASRFVSLPVARRVLLACTAGALALAACAPAAVVPAPAPPSTPSGAPAPMGARVPTWAEALATVPRPDPRVGLAPGLFDAGQALWNLRLLAAAPPPETFVGQTNSDLAFTGNYAIQGNYNGVQIWDLTTPAAPSLVRDYVCPASQSDVSVYGHLLFVSGEGLEGRLDCGTEGVDEAVSPDRLRGIRIFDISDIRNPRYVSNVQTCRGSHTHSVLKDPDDDANVYVYVSGSAPVRPAEEVPGCSSAAPDEDPNSALFRIEVIRVPLAHPEQAAIVSSPRIFEGLLAPPRRTTRSPADVRQMDEARARGQFIITIEGQEMVLPDQYAQQILAGVVRQRGGTGAPTAADSATVRQILPGLIAQQFGSGDDDDGPEPGPTQCHDITLYPALGLAGGACEGYGLLLDIRDPVNPRRLQAVADSNFSYWHSATFNNDGTKILFTDEWGGGGQPKCRADDPPQWGANALFALENGQMVFKSYYKLPAPQTAQENCVAHNGSILPIPGRDVMVQSWYQGGVSVFDWTDIANPVEIAFFDRGPVSAERMESGGTWSVYWYNGTIVSSEIARGLDVLELMPSAFLTQNEIDAAKTVRLNEFNTQGQPRYVWPPSFALARAYADQLERSRGLAPARLAAVRAALATAESASGATRRTALQGLASALGADAAASADAAKVRMLADAVGRLAG